MGLLTSSRPSTRRPHTRGTVSYASSITDASSIRSYDAEKNTHFLAKIAISSTEDEIGVNENTISHLYSYLEKKNVFTADFDDDESVNRSAVVMKAASQYRMQCQVNMPEFIDTATRLDARVMIVIDNPISVSPFNKINPNVNIIKLSPETDTVLQIFDNLSQVARARLDQPQVFVRQEQLLILWADTAHRACMRAIELQDSVLEIVWNDDSAIKAVNKEAGGTIGDREVDLENLEGPDLTALVAQIERRPRKYISAVVVALAWALMLLLLGLTARTLLVETLYDGTYIRFAILAYYPVVFMMSMFFFVVIISSIFQIFGPIGQVFKNSFSYSAVAPPRTRGILPHVTVQCPVYKESLTSVISKTVDSVAVAMRRYELQGGSCNLLICDDRMQLVDPESARFRKQYYCDNNIGWVARPGHNKDGFIRAGKFKKASNMNFTLNLSMKVETALEQIERSEDWTSEMEQMAYNDVLQKVLSETPLAMAGGNIRVGDLILLVDSDTRVPSDCLIDAASEFEQSPDLGILQHVCGVMQVTHDYFENGITWFTNFVYRCISLSCANGDVAPFVGHNAFIRWAAVQEAATVTEDGYVHYWSEDHVSEDFDMALTLQALGYTIRFATYSKGQFEEGVSLSIFDELLRWEKYSYGCSELLFNPIYKWLWKGPFAPTFWRFVFSTISPAGKFTIFGYIGSYYALGGVWITTLANYFVTGWYAEKIDHAYLSSFDVFLSLVVVFYLLCPISHAVARSRMGDESLLFSLYDGYKWMLFWLIFFGGISFHVSKSLLCHFFGIPVEWGATAKELERSDFFKEMQIIIKKFKYMYMVCILLIGGMVYLAFFAPLEWRINGLNSCLPLAWSIISHMLLPAVLNPQLFKSA